MTRSIAAFLLLACVTALYAQPTTPTAVPVTGWFDGNPSPTDGVPHGTGFRGAGGLWTPWLRPAPDELTPWPSILVFQPQATFGSLQCGRYLGGDPSSLIPLTDPDGHVSLYVFGTSAFDGNPPDYATTGIVRDPLGVVTRYWDGSYDSQQFLTYLSNAYLDFCQVPDPNFPDTPPVDDPDCKRPQNCPGPDCVKCPVNVEDCNKYSWGNGPFGGVVKGPEVSPQKLYMFFGADRVDVDHGRGEHLIGVSNPPVNFQPHNGLPGGLWEAKFLSGPGPAVPAPTSTFQSTRWFDTTAANHVTLNKVTVANTKADAAHTPFNLGILDQYNPVTDAITNGEFTPVLARVGRRPQRKNSLAPPPCDPNAAWGDLGPDPDNPADDPACQLSRIAQLTGIYRDGYFYLFLGLNTRSTISVRIPYDAMQANGLHRRAGTGAIDAEMWYIDATHPQGAYQPIDTSQPISFSDDVRHDYCDTLPPGTPCLYPSYCLNLQGTPCLGNANPPVLEANALLRDTGNPSGTTVDWPAGLVPYAANDTYWMTSGYHPFPVDPIKIHRLKYDATNPLNPWSVASPFKINYDGTPCPSCTQPGNYTLPSLYLSRATAMISPLSRRRALGFFDVDFAACTGNGLLPFTIGDDALTDGLDFEITTGCSYSLTPSLPLTIGAGGGTQAYTITTSTNCAWSGATSAAFLTLSPTSGTSNGSATLTVAVNTGAARSGYINIAGRQITVNQGGAGAPNPPTNVQASTLSTTAIRVTWTNSSSSGVTGYNVYCATDTGAFVLVTPNPVQSPFNHISLTPGLAYRYKVLAWNGSTSSGDSNIDLATTILFDDPTLIRYVSAVRAIHVMQIRQAVDAVRHAAGFAPATYTDPSLCQSMGPQNECVGGVTIKKEHVQELRDRLVTVLPALNVAIPIFTDSPLASGTLIKKEHVEELRSAVQ